MAENHLYSNLFTEDFRRNKYFFVCVSESFLYYSNLLLQSKMKISCLDMKQLVCINIYFTRVLLASWNNKIFVHRESLSPKCNAPLPDYSTCLMLQPSYQKFRTFLGAVRRSEMSSMLTRAVTASLLKIPSNVHFLHPPFTRDQTTLQNLYYFEAL